MLPIIRPDVSFDEVADDLRAVIDSGTLTGGPAVEEFEAGVAEAVGTRHAVAVTSATTAMHLVLHALGIGSGDEVLVSDFTFPATGNVVVQLGALPVLVDSRSDSFALDLDHAGSLVTARTVAILAVDPFGQPADLPGLRRLAERHGLAVIEDAACGLGAGVGDTRCGSVPNAGCFSFHPRKVVTTGEGGAVTTDDAELAGRLRMLRSHGGVTGPAVGLSFEEHGFNYRMGAVPAAIGLAQLRRLDAILADRRATAARYEARLPDVAGVAVRTPTGDECWSYQSFVVLVDPDIDRDSVVAAMRAEGIETTLGTYAMHAHPAFAHLGVKPGDRPHSFAYQQRSLTLPLVPHMAEDDVDLVVSTLGRTIGEIRGR